MNELKKLWIAWENDASIRSSILAKHFGADFHPITKLEGDKKLLIFRYLLSSIQTFLLLMIKRPDILVVQNPSIVLSFIATILKPFFRYRLVMDLHTSYIHVEGIKKVVFETLNNFALRYSDVVVVTNHSYRKQLIHLVGGQIVVLPDKIPEIYTKSSSFYHLKGKKNVLFICTFSEDEPWEEVIKAGKLLKNEICIYISGKNKYNIKDLPPNVILTGFLPLLDYHSLLHNVNAVIVLTTQDDCLVCGGYEALGAEKPLILSNKKALKLFYNSGVRFTEHYAEKIADTISEVLKIENILKSEIKTLKSNKKIAWEKDWETFLKVVLSHQVYN